MLFRSTVTGTGSYGINAWDDSVVTVKGNVTVTGTGSYGIYFGDAADITLDGKLKVSGTDSIPVVLWIGGGEDDVCFPPAKAVKSEGYLVYADDDNSDAILRIKDSGGDGGIDAMMIIIIAVVALVVIAAAAFFFLKK